MATYKKTLQNKNGDVILPRTTVSAVYLEDMTTTIEDAIDLKAPLASPTFTGTVSGITATMVGLGNVTNESKSTMFASPTFTGTPTVSGSGRVISDSASTGTDIYYVWSGTQAQYEAIATKDGNTLYFIV